MLCGQYEWLNRILIRPWVLKNIKTAPVVRLFQNSASWMDYQMKHTLGSMNSLGLRWNVTQIVRYVVISWMATLPLGVNVESTLQSSHEDPRRWRSYLRPLERRWGVSRKQEQTHINRKWNKWSARRRVVISLDDRRVMRSRCDHIMSAGFWSWVVQADAHINGRYLLMFLCNSFFSFHFSTSTNMIYTNHTIYSKIDFC